MPKAVIMGSLRDDSLAPKICRPYSYFILLNLSPILAMRGVNSHLPPSLTSLIVFCDPNFRNFETASLFQRQDFVTLGNLRPLFRNCPEFRQK